MLTRLLVAIDDTPAALRGARLAVELARITGATLYAVAVAPPEAPPAPRQGQQPAGSRHSAERVLHYVEMLAGQQAVPVELALRTGEPAPCVLDHARKVAAELLVVGRSGRRGLGEPYIGSQTRQVLEFAECPVLVVPAVPTAAERGSEAHRGAGAPPTDRNPATPRRQ